MRIHPEAEQSIKVSSGSRRSEIAALAALLLVGLAARLAFVAEFPTRPVSDFRGLLNLALAVRGASWTVFDPHWDLYSPGLPLALSVLLRLFPGPPETVARIATAAVCGLLPLLPFAIWRGVLPLGGRALAGGMLALWPGQVLFTGVVAQDNWVLLPTVALGALAARSLLTRDAGHPLAAGLLYGLGVAIRQEMLVALLPLLLAAGGLGSGGGRRPRNLGILLLATVLPLLAIATHRSLATGHFALTSSHGGLAMLGSYVPGASEDYWADPLPYIASVDPPLLRDRRKMEAAGFRLAAAEARRRPGFHALRILASVVEFSIHGEDANLYWSLGSPEVLPAGRRARAGALVARAFQALPVEMVALQALFMASFLLGAVRRNRAILILGIAVLAKIALHALVVAQGRYFLAATALEVLAIALGAWEAARSRNFRLPAAALALGTLGAAALWIGAPRLDAAVRKRDRDVQRLYRFPVEGADASRSLDCVVASGRLVSLVGGVATLEPFHRDPAPGETAAADCTVVTRDPSLPLAIRIHDGYDPGGRPLRMLQRVLVDGREALSHDLAAEPGTGWLEVPLGASSPNAPKRVRIEIVAVHPEPGAAWGRAASTQFQLVTAGGPR